MPTVSPQVSLATAAAADQFAGPLPDQDRPAFSYLVLGAAQGWGDRDADGAVTLAEAVDYATVALVTGVTTRRQTPALLGAGDLVLGSGEQRSPGLDVARVQPTKARSSRGSVPWIVSGSAFLAGAAALGTVSVVADQGLGSPRSIRDVNDSYERARISGIAAWSSLGAGVGLLTVAVVR